MAIQNFISGGYYGKLGVTVGQRWKNIRTIRSYVVPHDPKTAKQLVQRGIFAQTVVFSQVANMANYDTTAFDTTNNTKWALRMSAARANYDQDKTELDLIPLYPNGFSVPYAITSAVREGIDGGGNLILTVSGNLPDFDCNLNILAFPQETSFDPELIGIIPCTYTVGSSRQITIASEYASSLLVGDKVRFISLEEADSDTLLVGSDQLILQNNTKPQVTFLTTVQNVSIDNSGVLVRTSQPYENGANTLVTATLHYIAQGAEQTNTISNSTLINDNGYFAIQFDIASSDGWNKPALPSGCYVEIANIEAETDTTDYIASDVTESATSTDLTRNVSISWESDPLANYEVSLVSLIRSNTEISKTVSIFYELRSNLSDGGIDTYTHDATLLINSSTATLKLAQASGEGLAACFGTECTISQFTETINGVSYVFTSQTVEFTNLETSLDAISVADDFTLGYVIESGVYKYRPFIMIGCDGKVFGIVQGNTSTTTPQIDFLPSQSGHTSWYLSRAASYENQEGQSYLYIPLTDLAYGEDASPVTFTQFKQGAESRWNSFDFYFTISENGITYTQSFEFEYQGNLTIRTFAE